MRERIAILLILSALVVREAWMLLPESPALYRPFPYCDIEIGAQTYFGFVCHYAFILIIAVAFWYLVEGYRDVVSIWVVLQAVEFVDYFLTYNTAWFTFLGIGVGITYLKITTLSLVISYKLWNQ